MVAVKRNIKDGQLLAVNNSHTTVPILLLHSLSESYCYVIMAVDVDLLNDRGLEFSFIVNFHLLINAVKDNSCAIIFAGWYHSQFTDPSCLSLIVDAVNEQGIDGNVVIADQVEG